MITAIAIVVWLLSVILAIRFGVSIGGNAASEVFWKDHDERRLKRKEIAERLRSR